LSSRLNFDQSHNFSDRIVISQRASPSPVKLRICIYDGRFAPASLNCGCRKATELVSRAFCRTCLILRTSGYTPDCGLRGFLFRRLDR
jgi:hypothetical protein